MALNIPNIKKELIYFLRNQDILTTTIRGVTTTSATGTLATEDTITIAVTNVKNIRSVTVASVSKSFGTDYTYNIDHASGCVITFATNQTGAYSVSYDYGSDKIHPDFPRDDLTINSYPRIATDIISIDTDAFGIGGSQFISNLNFTIVVYDDNLDDIDSYIQAIKTALEANANSFYYLGFIKPTLIGPCISSPDRSDEIMQRNIDFQAMFQVSP